MYGSQIWSLHEVQGIYGCVVPSYELNTHIDNSVDMGIRISYTKDPNRTSIKKINRKNILNVNKVLKNLDITDCIYTNQIVKDLLEKNMLKECKQLLEGYNLTLANVDTLLKIDKTRASKNALETSEKNKLAQIILGDNYSTANKKRKKKILPNQPVTKTNTTNTTNNAPKSVKFKPSDKKQNTNTPSASTKSTNVKSSVQKSAQETGPSTKKPRKTIVRYKS
jgi:hypothetical protein